ncbi:MAG: SUMF1/EgtB/PvdO family nonheme iron enzyme [Candidatus Sedimenticola sp. (ex Thyasira tokunagai)]
MGYFKQRLDAADLGPLFIDMLKRGRVVILLDGLDEVKSLGQRNKVVTRVQQFLCQYAKKGNRVVVSSRIIGYREVRPPEVEGLRECTLLDFEYDEIADFVSRWTTIVERHAFEKESVAKYQAKRETEELLAALELKPEIRRLAANPLLLTMLVIQKRQGITLPRHRVLLYERYITSMLDEWLQARNLDHEVDTNLPDDRKLRKVLEPLAHWMQSTSPGKGMVPEARLIEWLANWFSRRDEPEEVARRFLKDVREHSGLLLDRGGRMYGFMHLTFMEYLAAVTIAKKRDVIIELYTKYAGHADWREPLLLTASCLGLRDGRDEELTELLEQLLELDEGDQGSRYELVAAALADMGEGGVTEEGWFGLKDKLVRDGLCNQRLPADKRVAIGNHLAEMGDPRRDVLVVDALQFCCVPPGRFFLGSESENAYDSEKTGASPHEMKKAYWLARYPVTVAQYRQYLHEAEVELGDEDCLNGAANTPVVRVSQKEAQAFCDWLNERWRQAGWLPEGYRVSLPSEPEWEMAAKGGYEIPATDQQQTLPIGEFGAERAEQLVLVENTMPLRDYPWGEEANPEKMNFKMNIGAPSAVGAYPEGASPYGCEEMSGNVWEWTRSSFANYPYPTIPDEVREVEMSGDVPRVLRGGAFGGIQWVARCSYRGSGGPDFRDVDFGFRVVLSPLL